MSYESEMLKQHAMPSRVNVAKALLVSLFRHNGIIKEFGSNENIVQEIADDFGLTVGQRGAYLKTVYRKEHRVKRTSLWHRLLFRAADSLAKEGLVTRPTKTFLLTNERGWLLTENGYDTALEILNIPKEQKELLPVKSYEVEKIATKLLTVARPVRYNPFKEKEKNIQITKMVKIRERAFRQAVIEAYGFSCAVCRLKLCAPKLSCWEVEAAHIVPHSSNGKDDIWNGLALCRLHHWAFDVGWFSLDNSFNIIASRRMDKLASDMGKIYDFRFLGHLKKRGSRINLPLNDAIIPHETALSWHRENVFMDEKA